MRIGIETVAASLLTPTLAPRLRQLGKRGRLKSYPIVGVAERGVYRRLIARATAERVLLEQLTLRGLRRNRLRVEEPMARQLFAKLPSVAEIARLMHEEAA